jgi:hypothetical protein
MTWSSRRPTSYVRQKGCDVHVIGRLPELCKNTCRRRQRRNREGARIAALPIQEDLKFGAEHSSVPPY